MGKEGRIDGCTDRDLIAIMVGHIAGLPAQTTQRCRARGGKVERGWRGVRLRAAGGSPSDAEFEEMVACMCAGMDVYYKHFGPPTSYEELKKAIRVAYVVADTYVIADRDGIISEWPDSCLEELLQAVVKHVAAFSPPELPSDEEADKAARDTVAFMEKQEGKSYNPEEWERILDETRALYRRMDPPRGQLAQADFCTGTRPDT